MDIVTLGAALKGAKAYTDATIAPLLGGVHYRGSVNYFNNLPSNPSEGDAYTVKYSGTSGTSPDGTEYVWALDTDDNTYKWIGFSPDTYTKAEVDNLLNGKQATIDSSHKLSSDLVDDANATNKFATAAELEQIETNKTNISLVEQMNGAKNYIYYAATTTTYTTGGADLTVTNNGDGTMTINGTTGSSVVNCSVTRHAVKPMMLTAGDYVLSGIDSTSPEGVEIAVNEYGQYVKIATITSQNTTAIFSVISDGEYTCTVNVDDGKTIDNLMLKPMICKKSVYDSGLTQFMPYAMSNAEITAWILSQS